MAGGTRVPLPAAVRPPFEVFRNGVRQREGADYDLRGLEIVFRDLLVKEGRLGFWRWFLGAWGIGTYRRNDVIDLSYTADGRPRIAHDVPFETAPEPAAPGPPRTAPPRGA